MKITFNETEQKFTPFEFTVKIETLEDARAWYAIFNYTPNTELLGIGGSQSSKIRAELCNKTVGDVYCYNYGNEVIANGVTYEQYYK